MNSQQLLNAVETFPEIRLEGNTNCLDFPVEFKGFNLYFDFQYFEHSQPVDIDGSTAFNDIYRTYLNVDGVEAFTDEGDEIELNQTQIELLELTFKNKIQS